MAGFTAVAKLKVEGQHAHWSVAPLMEQPHTGKHAIQGGSCLHCVQHKRVALATLCTTLGTQLIVTEVG